MKPYITGVILGIACFKDYLLRSKCCLKAVVASLVADFLNEVYGDFPMSLRKAYINFCREFVSVSFS